jgi:hypothetical protein
MKMKMFAVHDETSNTYDCVAPYRSTLSALRWLSNYLDKTPRCLESLKGKFVLTLLGYFDMETGVLGWGRGQ